MLWLCVVVGVVVLCQTTQATMTVDQYNIAMQQTFHQVEQGADFNSKQEEESNVSFLEIQTNLQLNSKHTSRTNASTALANQALTVAFVQSGINQQLKRHLKRDIGELESQQALTATLSTAVSFFNDAFIDPFIQLFTMLILRPLEMAVADVMPWYLTGPIANTLNNQCPKPVTGGIDALLSMYMPPLVAIAITKKLVKGLTMVLTASVVSTVEQCRTGSSGARHVGDGDGATNIITHEITRRLGVDITNHLMDTVPRATERALSHTLSASLSTSVQYYYYCTYCYWFGDYCKLCFYLPDYTWKESQFWSKQRQSHLEGRDLAKGMQDTAESAMAGQDKPLSPITAPAGSPEAYQQKMNNDLALDRRQSRLEREGRRSMRSYATRMRMKLPPIAVAERVTSESTVA